MQRKKRLGKRTKRGKQSWQIRRSIVVTAVKSGEDLLAAVAPRLQPAPA
jgi:hypothetical protein